MKQHLIKKHRPRSVDSEEEGDDAKKAKKDKEKEETFDESVLDAWDKEGEVVTSSQMSNLEEILSKFDGEGKSDRNDEGTNNEETNENNVVEKTNENHEGRRRQGEG